MKRWAILTVLLYLVALCLLSAPLLALAFSELWSSNNGISFGKALEVYREWGYWLWLVVMGAGQALLLLLPLDIRERKLTPRRPLLVPVLTSTFFLANLCVAGLFSVLFAIFKDDAGKVIEIVARWVISGAGWNPATNSALQAPGNAGGSDWVVGLTGALTIIACFWLVWAFVFFRFAKTDGPDALVKRITRWLLRGSILELLVAVPSHIIVRRREDCCAPFGTFWGITMGLSVMLLCFGPGVFFLFADRFQRLRPKNPDAMNGLPEK